jgi:transporter family-2 protein
MSQTPFAVAILVVVAGGVALSLQAPLNASLSRGIGSSTGAAAVSFAVGFVVLTLVTAATGGAGAFLKVGGVPSSQLLGGCLGAYYVWAVVWGVPQLGVLTMVAALILGQMMAALAIDATGALGLAQHPVTWTRVAAAGLVAAGVVLSRV